MLAGHHFGVLWEPGAPGNVWFSYGGNRTLTAQAQGDKSNAAITISQHKSLFNHFQQDQYTQEGPSFLGGVPSVFQNISKPPEQNRAAGEGEEGIEKGG